jgi:Zn-dependent protease
VFAAPGAVYIYGLTDEKKDAKISLSGPLANMIVAVSSLALFRFSLIPLLAQVAYVSAFIGVFNLLPFGPLDGAKIFRHEKMWWVALMAIGAIIILTI